MEVKVSFEEGETPILAEAPTFMKHRLLIPSRE